LFVRVGRMILWRSSRLFQSLFSVPKPAAAAAGAASGQAETEFGHQGTPKSPHF